MNRSPELAGRIAREVRERGPLRFDRFMELALYEPQLGYYARRSARIGRAGDFVTAPSYPAFGRTLARLVPLVHGAAGRPDALRLVDAGAGEGGLLAALLPEARRLLPGVALDGVLVERGPALRARARQRLADAGVPDVLGVSSLEEVAALAPRPGVVLANELLDALPVRRLRRSGPAVEEAHVDLDRGEPVLRWLRLPVPEEPGLEDLREGREVAVAPGLAPLVSALGAAVERGLVLVADYGGTRPVLRCPGGGEAVRGFSGGRLVTDLLASPGEVDLTAGVDWSAVAAAASCAGLETVLFTEQLYLLLALGFLADPEAARSKRLIHPEDMGSAFFMLVLAKGIDTSEMRRLPVRDRSSRLAG